MKNGRFAAFIFDGFADHHLSMVLAALNQPRGYTLETFSTSGRTVTSAGGLRVLPHTSLKGMTPEDFDVLLLPGGRQWERGDNLDIFPLLQAIAGRQPLIAMGEAVLALADLGILDHIPHTGEGPGYFERYCPEYAGARFFRSQPFVTAGAIITVAGRVFCGSRDGMLGLFDILQKISANNHELFDPARPTFCA